jgi:hypothetical protein
MPLKAAVHCATGKNERNRQFALHGYPWRKLLPESKMNGMVPTDDVVPTAIRGEPCQTWSWTDEVVGVENERYDSLLV